MKVRTKKQDSEVFIRKTYDDMKKTPSYKQIFLIFDMLESQRLAKKEETSTETKPNQITPPRWPEDSQFTLRKVHYAGKL